MFCNSSTPDLTVGLDIEMLNANAEIKKGGNREFIKTIINASHQKKLVR
jgi:hypothetical protein